MRILRISALGLLALASLSVAAEAGPCPSGYVWICRPSQPHWCHCVPHPMQGGGSTGGNQGKAEIHKKNVPTVKPNKSPGPND